MNFGHKDHKAMAWEFTIPNLIVKKKGQIFHHDKLADIQICERVGAIDLISR